MTERNWVKDTGKAVIDWDKRYADSKACQFLVKNSKSRFNDNAPTLLGEAAIAFETALKDSGLLATDLPPQDIIDTIDSIKDTLISRVMRDSFGGRAGFISGKNSVDYMDIVKKHPKIDDAKRLQAHPTGADSVQTRILGSVKESAALFAQRNKSLITTGDLPGHG